MASQDQHEKTRDREVYTVGWICALPIELAAAQVMRDEKHDPVGVAEGDTNSYVLGRIAAHDVVMACLPQGTIGTNAAATVATNMLRSFPQIRFILMVGVGAGAPEPGNVDTEGDIRLGDVVVSKPDLKNGGVVQYDFGKTLQSGVARRGKALNKPPPILRTAVARLEALHLVEGSIIEDILQATYKKYPRLAKKFQRPSVTQDVLFKASYEHLEGQQDCRECQMDEAVARQSRDDLAPVVHYGLIASANQVMRDAFSRDKMRRELGVICFEMEAAGLMDDCPCLVVRGICDYADSHKNKQWQPYAALTAAAYGKELLQSMQASSVRSESVLQLTDILRDQTKVAQEHVALTRKHYHQQDMQYQDKKHQSCHRIFKTTDYESQKNINPDAVVGTCRWFLEHAQYQSWSRSKNDLLWVSADPGCGKSVLSKLLVDVHLSNSSIDSPRTVCYFFFKDNEQQNSVPTALCAILHQLFTHQPHLIHHALPAFDKKGDQLQHDIHELWRILQSIASDVEATPIMCVIDALDECRETDRAVLIDLLCQCYGNSRKELSIQSSLKWLVTSRPYDDVRDRFERIPLDLPSIRLRGEDESERIRDEINLVIDERVRQLSSKLTLSTTKTEDIRRQLRDMEHRTYLWLHLAFDDIENSFQDTFWPYDQVIVLVPATVEEAYERILARVSSQQRELAKAVLTIIVGARRPLTVEEMALALSITTLRQVPTTISDLNTDSRQLGHRIRRWCGLFVFISGGRLYLLHQTAKEFLVSKVDTLRSSHVGWKHCLSALEVQKQLAMICVRYLCLSEFNDCQQQDDVKEEQEISSIHTFFCFAAEHWATHVRITETYLDAQTRMCVQALYEESSERWGRWTSAMWQRTKYGEYESFDMNSVQLAAFNGHNLQLQSLLETALEIVDSRNSLGHNTALMWASECGFIDVVQTLLSAGAEVNASGGSYGTALRTASYRGHDLVVQTLLEAGAWVDARTDRGGTALLTASYQGHDPVVQTLLKAGADVDAFGGLYSTALMEASDSGHDLVVQTLLKAGADVNARTGRLGTALQAAAEQGHDLTSGVHAAEGRCRR